MPQPPQLPGSKAMFTQTPPQFVPPAGQGEHTPFEQMGVAPEQTLPQPPQFSRSDARSVQTPAQTVPVAQPQTPPRQWGAAGSAHGQPQAPQLAGSVTRSL